MEDIKLFQGDCLEVMKDIPSSSIDMILCDLPYGTTRNKWDSLIDLNLLWSHYERIIKDNGAIVLFAQAPFDKVLGSSNLKLFRYEWIWEKSQVTGFLNSKKMPLKSHENILVFYKKLPVYNPQMREGKPYKAYSGKGSSNYNGQNQVVTVNNGLWYPITNIKFSSEKGFHPTQKPVKLLEFLVKTYTNEGQTVLDNCMGSGSTGIACLNTNRKFIGIEKDYHYFSVSTNRINSYKKDMVYQ